MDSRLLSFLVPPSKDDTKMYFAPKQELKENTRKLQTNKDSKDNKQHLNLNLASFLPPYKRPSSTALHWLDTFMRLTHDHPDLMKRLVYINGASSLLLIASPWLLSAAGINISSSATIGLGCTGGINGLLSITAGFIQHRLFGFPAKKDEPTYQTTAYDYKSATAKLKIEQDGFPLLTITAQNNYDAGYAEGYILGNAIDVTLSRLNSLYNLAKKIIGTPASDQEYVLSKHLQDVVKTIPQNYLQEMRGKVDGFNQWLKENKPNAKQLKWEFYLLMQLLPDLRNYNPLPTYLFNLCKVNFGCTTMVFRLGGHTVFSRVLDWPSYGIAANYFIQVERNIQGSKKTADIGFPLVSGLMTAINEDGLLVEINVASGKKVKTPKGMPSLFFNRYCAEHATSVKDIHEILKKEQPLGAYHMTTTDGFATESFHFYQNMQKQDSHIIESLDTKSDSPQLLVVANAGVKVTDDQIHYSNYRDSNERVENAKAFFNHVINAEPADKKWSREELKEIAVNMARLPLISNHESTLFVISIRDEKTGERVTFAAKDNNFVADKPLSQFKKISFGCNSNC